MAPKNVDDIYPLSPMQRLMLLHEVSTPDRGTLANQICHRIRGPLRADPLRRAFGQLAARHPALRTCVLWEGLDEPLQVVRSTVEVPFETVDLRGLPPAEREARTEAVRRDDEARGHTIGRAPLMRATLVHLEDERHLLIWNLHHLVADRWSFSRLVFDLGRLYGAEVADQPAGLERSRGFRDYIAWLKAREPTETDRYWRNALSGLEAPTLLAPAPEAGARRHTSLATLPASATSGLERIAAAARVSTAAVVMASLGLATASRTGKSDVVIGLTVAGRPPDLPGVEDIVGSFVNNVPARFRIDRTTTLSDWLRSIQVEQVRRLPHEHASLARIHDLSTLPGDQPLFDLLTVMNLDRPERATLGDLDFEAVRATLEGGYPLILQVARGDDDLRLTLVHSGPKAAGEALLADFTGTLNRVCRSDGDATLAAIVELPHPTVAPPDASMRGQADSGASDREIAAQSGTAASQGDLEAVVWQAWTGVLGLRTAHLDDDFFALGGTSLQAARLLARLEANTGRLVPVSALVTGRTLRSLLEAVDAPSGPTGPLVVIRPGGRRPPLIAVPGVRGNVLLYPPLADRLGPGRPVYGLQARGVEGDAPRLGTMEAIAADFIEQLEPLLEGGVHLFGLCWGAAAAFEIAAQLESQGRPPLSLSLLDPTALGQETGPDGGATTGGHAGFVFDRLGLYWDEFRDLEWSERARMIREKSIRLADVIRGRIEPATRQELRERAVVQANLGALERYRPGSIAVRSRIFLARDWDPGEEPDHRLAWLPHFAPEASIRRLPGTDSGDVINAHTHALARSVDEWLDRIEEA